VCVPRGQINRGSDGWFASKCEPDGQPQAGLGAGCQTKQEHH
jgi:hypothetical protein